MEMWVRALMCEHPVALRLAAERKQPRLEHIVNSALNLGQGDSPEQRQLFRVKGKAGVLLKQFNVSRGYYPR